MNKFLVFDIDGTLLNSRYDINKSSILAIKSAKKNGFKIVLCSGRPFFDIEPLQKQYRLADYIVCNNGAYWYDVTSKKFYFTSQINPKIAKQAIIEGQKFCALLALHTDKATYRSQLCNNKKMPTWFHEALDDEKALFLDQYNYPLLNTLKHLESERILQVAFRLDENGAQKLASQMRQVLKNDVDIFIANYVYVDVNMHDVNKYHGLKNMCQVINCDPQNMIAFGDSDNDLQMLANVGYGICMGNGTEEAKKVAKEVIGDNDSDAISEKISQIISQS